MEILKIIQVYGITDENNVSLENNDESKLGNIQDTAGNNGLINEQNTQIKEYKRCFKRKKFYIRYRKTINLDCRKSRNSRDR